MWGGGGTGVRGWLSPGGRYTRIPDPGRGHTPPRGGGARGAAGLDPKRRGALIKIYFKVVVIKCKPYRTGL